MVIGDSPGARTDTMTLREVGERGLIERIRRRFAAPRPGVLIGIGDDTAAVAWAGGTLLLTTDVQLEDVHFRRATSSFTDVGAKALAVNLSDIAAMGGEPCFALIAVALPTTCSVEDVDALYEGLAEMASRYGVALVGGDTCRAPDRLMLTVTLVGRVDGAPLTRSGARPGDVILVTGTLGAAAAGLVVLERGPLPMPIEASTSLARAHRRPIPRVPEGRMIHASGAATAMIDLSDGLASDLGHIAAESAVGAVVRLPALPIGEATRQVAGILREPAWRWAVSGGEDYELLFTAAPEQAAAVATRVVAETGTPVSVIGEVRPADEGLRFLDQAGHSVEVRPGFDHFAP
jgi:thiamine-monophosphate kinase